MAGSGSASASSRSCYGSEPAVSFSDISVGEVSCLEAGGSPLDSLWEGRHQPRPQSRQSVSQSVSEPRLTGASSLPHTHKHTHTSHPAGIIRHLDATLLHETALRWLMETDIRNNVRECVRSFEKVS